MLRGTDRLHGTCWPALRPRHRDQGDPASGPAPPPAFYSVAVSLPENAKQAGLQAVESLRRAAAERLADMIRSDPEVAANAVEVGLVDKDWLEEPGARPVRTATTMEMVQRVLERSVEQRPSALSSLGLSAVQMLALESGHDTSASGSEVEITVMFTDLEGFTTYTARVGDAEAVELLQRHHRAVGPVIRSRGGRIVKRLGDGLLLSFPHPDAAVLAAVELVDLSPDPLRLRAGVHLGPAVVSHDDVMGHVVNVAARVTEQAKGGQVLVTDEVRTAVADNTRLSFGRRKRCRLKGVPEPVVLSRLQLAG